MSDIKEATGVVIKGPNDVAHGTAAIARPLAEDQVIVKVHSAPINPSDMMLLQGSYPAGKTHPCTAGLEGSGIVVEAGSGEMAQGLMGKRVAFFGSLPTHGTWADYCPTNAKTCFPLPDAINYEQAACALVNPLTVEAMMLECTAKGFKTIVHAGASSQLGRMMVSVAPKHGIKVINLVRREENVKMLKALGAEVVLDTTLENWETQMAELFAEHKPQAFFDPVAGEVGSKILAAMPPKSTTYNYGALGGFTYNVGVGDLIFQEKQLRGFWLNTELGNAERAPAAVGAMLTNLASGLYKTEVLKRCKTAEFAEAVQAYKGNMSAGKILFQNPNF